MRLASFLALAPLALAGCAAPNAFTASPSAAPLQAVAPAASAAVPATLHVEVTGAELADGMVRVELYASAEAFAAGAEPVRKAALMPNAGRVQLTFADVPPGTYAVHAYQDRDKSRSCTVDANDGMPAEPFTFSNDAGQALDAPPTFEMARFQVADDDVRVSMRLRPVS